MFFKKSGWGTLCSVAYIAGGSHESKWFFLSLKPQVTTNLLLALQFLSP